MMKAKEYIASRMETQDTDELISERLNALKPEINSLLMVNLPEHVTIKQANAISEVIYDMIANPDRYTD